MRMTFHPRISLTRGVPIVEVWYGDRFIATICPPPEGSDLAAFTIISKYLGETVRDDSLPAALVVSFDLDGERR